ncbi:MULTISPECIES: hypothetical protein [Streptomyces]|uniref:hypothetical protein n=1 Tax=Streptomyces TaxID=1883 RepID=UPI00287F53B5|nr:hypothetical protein [Streptomyces sp. CGMCC 4.1456]WNF62437.1 hypothetical protein RJD14_07480 [Streptomyces sp. CGMCC 4.1456]
MSQVTLNRGTAKARAPLGRVLERAGYTTAASDRRGELGTLGSFAASILVLGVAAAPLPAWAALGGETLER